MPIVTGIDIETTGLKQEKGDRIIEINCQLYDLATRERKINWTKRISPEGKAIAPAAAAVHGISATDLVGCPPWKDVAPSVQGILKKSDLVVAHNGDSFDLPFIAGELDRIGLDVPDVESFDTMLQGRWATGQGKPPSLEELAWACDEEYDHSKAHAADYDVAVMMACFWKGVEWGFFKLPERLAALLETKEAA